MNKADLKKVELVCAEVDDLRGEYFDGLGVIQIHAKLSVGDTSVEVIFQNQDHFLVMKLNCVSCWDHMFYQPVTLVNTMLRHN